MSRSATATETRNSYHNGLHAGCRGRSRLLHGSGLATKLALNQFTGPASSLNGARLELAVRLRLLDHGRQPVLAERLDELAVGIRISEVTIVEKHVVSP